LTFHANLRQPASRTIRAALEPASGGERFGEGTRADQWKKDAVIGWTN